MKKAIGFFVIAVMAAVGAYAVICRLGDKPSEKTSSPSEANAPAPILTINLVETNATQTTPSTVPPPASTKPPYKVALIVQNHTSDAPILPMAAFADTLAARLSGKLFRVVIPHNVIGTNQNRTARGEEMPEASALNLLSNDPEVVGVITASIQEFTGEDEFEGDVLMGHILRVRLALNFMDSTGGNICGVDEVNDSKFYPAKKVKSNTATLYEGLMHQSAAKAAEDFLAKVAEIKWNPETTEQVHVNFTCNRQGAVVKIDGIARGTAPGMVTVAKGNHNISVEYPFCIPFTMKAFLTDGQMYNTVLPLDVSGRERFKSEALFAETIDRIRKTGATDDYVRKTLADGTSQYWKNSGVKIDHGEVKDLKLDPPGGSDSIAPKTPTVDQLMEKARGL